MKCAWWVLPNDVNEKCNPFRYVLVWDTKATKSAAPAANKQPIQENSDRPTTFSMEAIAESKF